MKSAIHLLNTFMVVAALLLVAIKWDDLTRWAIFIGLGYQAIVAMRESDTMPLHSSTESVPRVFPAIYDDLQCSGSINKQGIESPHSPRRKCCSRSNIFTARIGDAKSKMKNSRSENLMTANQVAKLLHVSRAWVYQHAKRGEPRIPSIRLGRLIRFKPEEIRRLVERQTLAA